MDLCHLTEAEQARLAEHLMAKRAELDAASEALDTAILFARSVSLPWSAIAAAVGRSRQTLHERYGPIIAAAERDAAAEALAEHLGGQS
jgi:hypothetical protein